MSPSRCTRSVECDMNGGAGFEGCSGCEFESAFDGVFDCDCELAVVKLALAVVGGVNTKVAMICDSGCTSVFSMYVSCMENEATNSFCRMVW